MRNVFHEDWSIDHVSLSAKQLKRDISALILMNDIQKAY